MPEFDKLPAGFAESLGELMRYDGCDKHLRAFDAADHYILSEAADAIEKAESVWIIGDNFGALSCGVLMQYRAAGLAFPDALARLKLVYSDSRAGAQAIKQNVCKALASQAVAAISVERNAKNFGTYAAPDVVLARVPKNKTQLTFLLQQLKAVAAESTPIYLGGMDKHLSKGQFELLGKEFGAATYTRAKTKARVWIAKADLSLASSDLALKDYRHGTSELLFSSRPNSFSAGRLDRGAAFLLDNLERIPAMASVADLGCGNGVLGLSYAYFASFESLLLSDDSFQAVEACDANIALNASLLQEKSQKIRLSHSDALRDEPDKSLDLILCNPPFHTQNAVSRAVASRMFTQAGRLLVSGGELWVVANRHLQYHHHLRRNFAFCEQVNVSPQFVILRAVR